MNTLIYLFAALPVLALGGWLLFRRRAAAPAPVQSAPRAARERLSADALPGYLRDEAPASAPVPLPFTEDTGSLALQLMGCEDLEPAELETLRRRLSGIELPPRAVQQLMSAEFMAETSTRELTELLTREPLLSGRIIGRVNSPYYGLRTPIVSVAHAITYLGVNAVRNMALQFALEEALAGNDPELRRFHGQLLDVGSIAVSLVEALAPKLGVRDVSAASTQTVLSFLGDFVVPRLLPQALGGRQWASGLVERTASEQFSLGANAAIFGQLLMEAWELPQSIRDDVRDLQRVMVAPAPAQVGAREARLALCYFCARTAEAVALGRVSDAGQIVIADDCVPEFFQLQTYLARPPLSALPDALASAEFARSLQRLVARQRASAAELPPAAARAG